MRKSAATAATAAFIASAWAQNCISLAGSTTCSAFNASSFTKTDTLLGLYPFLQSVNTTAQLDSQLSAYVSQGYVQGHYINLFGCNNINLSNTTAYYARYTTSFICNVLVQSSVDTCGLTGNAARPLCADSCAEFAQSEETIISSSQLCSPRSSNYADLLRADFTNCALPADSLATACISGVTNEPNNCGFNNNIIGLCNYCRASTRNATDSCCVTSNAEGRCQGVTLPAFSSNAVTFSATATSASATRSASATNSATAGASSDGSGNTGLSGGAIAGIVIGSLLGLVLILALIVGACVLIRRRRKPKTASNFLNQPSPQRKGMTAGSYPPPPSSQQGFEVLPGGRVARMVALSGDDTGDYTATSDVYGDSPGSNEKVAGIIGGIKIDRSPGSGDEQGDSSNEYSSPEGVASGQSEQLPFFKDYYSNDDIHPGDKVSVLWAYQPRAGDEFELERGDMLKVIGIWDDGWATGVRISDRAEDYEGKHKVQRDSGVSNGTQQREEPSPPAGEIKAFPLVCICLPEAWKKTVDGDTSTEGSGPPNM